MAIPDYISLALGIHHVLINGRHCCHGKAELKPASREGGMREIEGQCFLDNVCFCLTLRFGKDGCFL